MFDKNKHLNRLQRAKNIYRSGNDFLIKAACDDMIERLGVVSRTFDQAAVLFGRTDYAFSHLSRLPQVTNVTRLEEAVYLGEAENIGTPTLLGLEPNQFDLILTPLSLHWSDDLPGSLIQISRALKPDGLLLANLPGPDTLFELRQSLLIAESETSAGAANRIDPFTDIRDAGSLLQRAGFALPVVDQETLTVRYDSVSNLINDLRSFGATSHLENSTNPRLTRDTLKRLSEVYAENFADPDGRIRATFSIVSLSGWVPHESQQKPLKPGSAKTRLADALSVDEIKLKR